MFGSNWKEGCESCSFWADNYRTALPYLKQRDVSFVTVSQASYAKIAAFKRRMEWDFDWVSAAGSSFGHDYHVSYSEDEIRKGATFYNYRQGGRVGEELPGLSVFARDEKGTIYHTYSAYARGLEPLNAVYGILDLVPRGRDEDDLDFTMAWVKHRDRYA